MKPLSAASEIDAWCTRCKMDLNHRVVALVMGVPKRAVCLTCGSEHNYHKPRSVKGAAPLPGEGIVVRTASGGERAAVPGARAAAAAARAASGAPARPRAEAASKISARALAEQQRHRTWEERVLGQAVGSFTRYALERRYRSGELVSHTRFGDGFVAEVLDGDKVSIMFKDGARTLAHGRP